MKKILFICFIVALGIVFYSSFKERKEEPDATFNFVDGFQFKN